MSNDLLFVNRSTFAYAAKYCTTTIAGCRRSFDYHLPDTLIESAKTCHMLKIDVPANAYC